MGCRSGNTEEPKVEDIDDCPVLRALTPPYRDHLDYQAESAPGDCRPSAARAGHRAIALVWADGGYTGRLIPFAAAVLALTLTVVKRSDDAKGFVELPGSSG